MTDYNKLKAMLDQKKITDAEENFVPARDSEGPGVQSVEALGRHMKNLEGSVDIPEADTSEELSRRLAGLEEHVPEGPGAGSVEQLTQDLGKLGPAVEQDELKRAAKMKVLEDMKRGM